MAAEAQALNAKKGLGYAILGHACANEEPASAALSCTVTLDERLRISSMSSSQNLAALSSFVVSAPYAPWRSSARVTAAWPS